MKSDHLENNEVRGQCQLLRNIIRKGQFNDTPKIED